MMRSGAAAGLLAALLLGACAGESGPQAASGTGTESADSGADPVSPVDSLLAVAEALYQEGEIDSAQTLFEGALTEARATGDVSAEAGALTLLGLAAWRLGDYEAARRLGEEALELKLDHGIHDQLFRSYNGLGLLAWNESRYFDALELYRRALELAEAASDSANLAKVWTNLGLVQTDLGDFVEARRLLLKALPIARALDDGLIEGRVLTNLGMLAVRTGDPIAGIPYLRQGVARSREVEDPIGEQNALAQLATAFGAVGEPGRAIAYADSALLQARSQGLRQEEASALEVMAELHRGSGDFRRALQHFEQAQAVNAELGFEDETGMDLRSQADIHATLGNLDMGLRLATEALEIHRRIGSRLEEVADHLALADLAHRAGRRDDAADHLASAKEVARPLEARNARLSVALVAARIADREGDSRTALRALSGAAADTAGASHDLAWEIHALAGRAHARSGDLESAVAAGRSAIETVERVRGQYASGVLRTSYLAEREAVYRELVDVLLRLDRTAEAFEVADAVRGRALVEHLAAARFNGGETVRELAEEERQILHQVDLLAQKIDEVRASAGSSKAGEYRSELDRLGRQLERTRAEYAVALVRAEERSGDGLALIGGRSPHARDVQDALARDEALLEYLVGPESVRLFVVTKDAVRTFRTEISRPNLSMQVRLARELVGRPAGDLEAAEPVLMALHDLVVGPAARSGLLARKHRLVVVPHAELTYVPFAALRDPMTRRYLVEDFEILHLPSAASLPALRRDQEARAPSRNAAAFAPFPEELIHSIREVEALGESMGGRKPVKGVDATEGSFRSALGDAAIVHAATHGVFNAGNPLFSRLEFVRGSRPGSRDDGRLEVHELISFPVWASLVFLSGCETGVGGAWATGFGRGEDYATLERAFLYAGARNVVATLWRVEDEGAAVLAQSFYRQLASEEARAEGSRISIAGLLAHAQRVLIANPRYRAPYYWAGYRVSGSGHLEPGMIRAKRSWLERLWPPFSMISAQGLSGVSVPRNCPATDSSLRRCA